MMQTFEHDPHRAVDRIKQILDRQIDLSVRPVDFWRARSRSAHPGISPVVKNVGIVPGSG